MRLLYPPALYQACLMLPHQASGRLLSVRSLKALMFPGVESDSAALADSIDVPFCFVGPSERFESS